MMKTDTTPVDDSPDVSLDDAILFSNENYRVIGVFVDDAEQHLKIADVFYDSWYELINASTGICEAKTICYPEALYIATAYNNALVGETWKPEEDRPPKNPKLTVVPRLN